MFFSGGINCPTQRAPDWWESARFQAFCVAWSWLRQNSVTSSRPPAGNASRWAANTMKELLMKTLPVVVLVLLLASCGQVENIQPSSTAEKQSTLTVFLSATVSPSATAASTQTVMAFPTTSEQATIEAFGSLCTNSRSTLGSEISTDEKWIAAACISENGTEDSPLQVVSFDYAKDWKIYFRDYSQGRAYDHKSIIIPYRWSNDGKYLYAVSPTKLSGCCWIGGKYILLVRLDLETGLVEELLNTIDPSTTRRNSFTISENDRHLLFTPMTEQAYDFAVLDLLSGETRPVKLKQPEYINLEYAIMSPYEDVIVLPYFENTEFNDYVIISIAAIDLSSNKQSVLVSDLQEGEELYPIHWIDTEHVLISNANPLVYHRDYEPPIEYWSLDIHTGERTTVDNP